MTSYHKNLRAGDLHSPSRELVTNNSGSTIPVLRAVNFIDSLPSIQLCADDLTICRGITETDINNGTTGYVCSLGFLNKVNTSTWIVGTQLYVGINGVLTDTIAGLPIATVLKQDPVNGVLYVNTRGVTTTDINAIIQKDSWFAHGNDNIDDTVNFLGTTTYQSLKIRTNDIERGIIDKDGRFGINTVNPKAMVHIKSQGSDDLTGKRIDPFFSTVNTTSLTTIYSFQVPNNSVAMIHFNVVARQDSTTNASFKRTMTVSRDGGLALILGPVQSDYTYKSNNGFDIKASVVLDTLYIKVKNANNINTNWSGSIEIEVVI